MDDGLIFLVGCVFLACRGHGTTDQDGEVVATLCGVVERVNKLVYVGTLQVRYYPLPSFFLLLHQFPANAISVFLLDNPRNVVVLLLY